MPSLLERAKKALSNRTPLMIPVTQIRRYKNQPRKYFDEEKLKQLSVSIDQSGQAIAGLVHAVKGDVPYELIDGERRWRSIYLIPENRRPLYKADLIEADEEVLRFLVSGMTNFNREGHTPMELAEAIDAYLSFGMKMSEIANVLGVSEMWCYQIHSLTKLDVGVAALMLPERSKNERLPVTAAIQISKIDKPLQMGIAVQVMAKKIPLGGIRKVVIETAKDAGVEVRTREVDPRKQWGSIKRRLTQARRALQDVRVRAESDSVEKYFQDSDVDRPEFVSEIKSIESMIERLSKKIEGGG
jgi:ParB/RepB/Spo0J family partition protein